MIPSTKQTEDIKFVIDTLQAARTAGFEKGAQNGIIPGMQKMLQLLWECKYGTPTHDYFYDRCSIWSEEHLKVIFCRLFESTSPDFPMDVDDSVRDEHAFARFVGLKRP